MKPKVAYIDSFNFSSESLESMLLDEEKYSIEVIKSVGVFEHQRWLEVFGKKLISNIIEAKMLHTHTGLTLAIKRYSSSSCKQTLEFAGLHSYNEKSKYLRELLKEIWGQIQDNVITRVDVAIDFNGNIPTRTIKKLKKSRRLFQWKNTTYLKTYKEKKSNSYINIYCYPKHKKNNNNLDYEMERLEFSFGSAYLRGNSKVRDSEEVYKKMIKTIKRLSGINIEIQTI
ncbi:MAG: hypothetical protein DRG78_10275 [Epsilonproteobacteria bacterium]|nr:MAG: hypothetical protein DRG78_10275 [Campylobacterota bacterium]